MTQSLAERYEMIRLLSEIETKDWAEFCKRFWVEYNLKYSKVVDEIKKKSDRNPFVKCVNCDG